MSFDWSEYLKLAQELAGQTVSPANEESRLRSSVSRAYFSAYCKARNYLRDIEGDDSIPSTLEAQTYVRNQFKSSPDRSRRKIGEDLGRLKNKRNKADYDDSVIGLSSEATMSLGLAQNVIFALSTLVIPDSQVLPDNEEKTW